MFGNEGFVPKAHVFRDEATKFLLFANIFPVEHATRVNAHESYAQEACKVTRYQNLCVKSLASYTNKARRSPIRWARAGVSVSLREVKLVARYLNSLKMRSNTRSKGRNRAALLDCVECFQDTLDNLHKSLGVLRRLSFGRSIQRANEQHLDLAQCISD
ncbi:hypothetical protein Cgig2_011649 [Carnegiea gigantea]|uniref:Pectinesterase inhibitor domain-containing protein n=1 Tax=Carnegiea gigantea TaxID=171969 RepID=A0A9Q1Q3Y3_9CARY|nr:hypothetical protein Cgig2_011649 [Carnegiea gigantea]